MGAHPSPATREIAPPGTSHAGRRRFSGANPILPLMRGSPTLTARMIDWSLLYLISEWGIRLVMLIYVPQRRSAAASRTWLLFIFLLPWPGVVLYWLFGRIYLPARRIQMQKRASRFIREAQAQI